MPTGLETLGMQLAGDAVNAGMGLMLGGINDKRQRKQQEKLMRIQMQGQREMSEFQLQKQLELWQKTGYGPQKKQMKEAGLNPALLYGMSGGGGQTAAAAAGSVTGGSASGSNNEGMAMMLGKQNFALMQAQIENIKADTKEKLADAQFTGGARTDNTQADTENKILQSVILDYTGRESKEMFEKVTSPAREVQAKTYQDELEARQGIAGTVYELWIEGKLKEKSVNEIEAIALGNAKSRAERIKIMKESELLEQNIKGKSLENMMTDLELKMQQRTGVDRNSPAWMKVVARLWAGLVGLGNTE